MTAREALKSAEDRLRAARIRFFEVDARILLAHALGKTLSTLPAHLREPISPGASAFFEGLIARREAREPAAYIVGETEFMGLRFKCDRRALIPRPDTEILVEEAIQIVQQLTTPPAELPVVIGDIGTGTGCIAVSLARFLPQARIIASDLSPEALDLAHENAALNDVTDRVEFLPGADLDPILAHPSAASLRVLVSNPPYITCSDMETLEPEVADYEPRIALDGGSDGLDPYRVVLSRIRELPALEAVLFEFGVGQGAALPELVSGHLPDWGVCVHPDLSGIPRVIAATRQ